MVIKLSQAIEKKPYIIESVLGTDNISVRLKELGFIKGTIVNVNCFSAKKKSALVCIRGYCLCIKSTALSKVLVKWI